MLLKDAGLHAVHLCFWARELAGKRPFAVFDQRTVKLCQPRTLVRGSGFSNPRERSGKKFRALALVAAASNSILRDADDQANSSGLSLKPALTGFSQM